ncbi:unnamed protein product [Schistosoma mansoni]|uniref:Smp_204370 n=1 Tax=Schistosoma mansoni TaxID=6183 RepID=G4LWY9_SCHMA|nr:unnamed protein product [Schistosoma mansoni]|eukprot:XP_018645778.1 unnamed protein product [Schistosoma mansoni]
MVALMTVQHNRSYYRNIFARVVAKSRIYTLLYEFVHGVQLNDARWLSLTKIRELFDTE